MKTYFKKNWLFIFFILVLSGYLAHLAYEKQQDKPKVTSSIKQVDTLARYTTKHTFDSLGIQLMFVTSFSKKQYLNYKEIYWIPRTFHVYDNGYFIWEGNLMDVFLGQKSYYPNCTFLLVGDYTEAYSKKLFHTRRVYVVWLLI